ncbi:MAG: hypothetical protein AB8G11_22250 [Saprospiraceae bacterium]
MKLYIITLLTVIPFFLLAQTTAEEYDYLIVEYPNQVEQSKIPEKDGYYFQDLMNMVDNSGKVRLLYKDNQVSVVPTATLIHVKGNKKVHYICVPHDDSDRAVFDRYADDLQQLFESDEVARNNYSKIMFRYPKQIQKYYDEISALENGLSTPITSTVTNKEPEVTTPPTKPEAKPELTNIEKPKKEESTRSADIAKEPKIEEQPKLKVVLTETKKPKSSASNPSASNGISTAKVRSTLAYRQLTYRPDILNETDKYGVVRVDICVNNKGQVISSKFNKTDSDTKNSELIVISERLAKKYTFEKSYLSRQCGHIIFKYQFQ